MYCYIGSPSNEQHTAGALLLAFISMEDRFLAYLVEICSMNDSSLLNIQYRYATPLYLRLPVLVVSWEQKNVRFARLSVDYEDRMLWHQIEKGPYILRYAHRIPEGPTPCKAILAFAFAAVGVFPAKRNRTKTTTRFTMQLHEKTHIVSYVSVTIHQGRRTRAWFLTPHLL